MSRLLPDTIETDRLLLREPRRSDAIEIFHAYGQDPLATKHLTWRPVESPAEVEGFLAETIKDWRAGARFAYVLERKSDPGRPIGMLDARILGPIVELGYVLARKHWGQGLMPEAVSALCAVALEQESVFRVQAVCDVENTASARTLEKCGFVREGRLERYAMHPNVSAEPRPVFMYARCR